jgi:hypothetical protein
MSPFFVPPPGRYPSFLETLTKPKSFAAMRGSSHHPIGTTSGISNGDCARPLQIQEME